VGKFSDKTLVCRDCGKEFTFSTGEQEFYATRGFSEPTRCPDCRAARKTGRGGGAAGFGGADRYGGGADRYGGGGSYGGGFGGGGRGSGGRGGRGSESSRPMFKAICADCGAETEVPFEPRQSRPVYCRDCFEKRSGRR
jgi:CxxC-x17-CxxC domain-containing protein